MKRGYANAFSFDPAKPLTLHFGRFPHKASGKVQVIDAASAAAFQEQIRLAIANGAPGLPIYAGHPDVPELAARYPDKAAKGWVTDCATGAESCSLPVFWNNAPDPGEFIYFSPYIFADDTGGPDAHIDELRSIGLTNRPNVTRFRLPNEAEDTQKPETSTGTACRAPERPTMKKLLTRLGLADTATEDEACAKLQGLMDETTALKRTGEENTARVAAANTETETHKTGFANERAARIALVLDCALADGRITPATRLVWEGRLRENFANEATALAQECAKIKTRSALPNEAGDNLPAAVLARYEALPAGPEKRKFLADHAVAINDARCALK